MNAAELFIKCLENEHVKTIFGLPGEENMDFLEALRDSSIDFVTVRHEQGAAFMADVYGRLTLKAGVCLSTLGPGATNLITGVADANMDRAPIIAIAGQASNTRLHKESHQVLDLVNLFKPISKYSTSITVPEIIPEVVRKAFKVSQTEKPGACFIEFPENVAEMEVEGESPLQVQQPFPSSPPEEKIKQVAQIISEAKYPIVLAGNGVIRAEASDDLVKFAEKLNIHVATTFMAKGVIPSSHPLSLGAVGLLAHDYVSYAFDKADVIICVGYDMVEYSPSNWHPTRDRKIIHIDASPSEVDKHYILAAGVLGDIGQSLELISEKVSARQESPFVKLKPLIAHEADEYADDNSFPIKPQKILSDLRKALKPEDIVISDVGAHKMWTARLYQAERPNTCIISNGFASMGIAVPGAFAAKMAFPDRSIVAVTGDAGFLMNSQEIETAVRLKIPYVILIWSDSSYGLISWKQNTRYGHSSFIDFQNPDLLMYSKSFGAQAYRVEKTEDLLPILKKALSEKVVTIIDCPVDYAENPKLTRKLKELKVSL